jgi:hypothetical protein
MSFYAKGGFLLDIDETTIKVLADAMASAPTADAEVYVLQLGGAVCDTDSGRCSMRSIQRFIAANVPTSLGQKSS